MKKIELIQVIAEDTNVPASVVKAVLESHTNVIVEQLMKTEKFRMTDIGTFSLVRKDNCEIRQPNGEPIKYKTYYRPRLKFAKRAKEVAASMSRKKKK